MLKTIYETYANLYSDIIAVNPALAADHALAQEADVYEKSTKMTYRNVRSQDQVAFTLLTFQRLPYPLLHCSKSDQNLTLSITIRSELRARFKSGGRCERS